MGGPTWAFVKRNFAIFLKSSLFPEGTVSSAVSAWKDKEDAVVMQPEFQGEPIVRAHCALGPNISGLEVAGCQTICCPWVHSSLGLLHIGHFTVIVKTVPDSGDYLLL